jgi:hypothetical protein
MATSGQAADARLTRWKKILAFYQAKGGALSCNNAKSGDTLRDTLVKVLRAILGICGQNAAPDVPGSINCGSVGGTSPQLDWVNGSKTQTRVEGWANVNNAGYALASVLSATATDFIGPPVVNPGDTVCIKVRACNGALCSNFTSECCVSL